MMREKHTKRQMRKRDVNMMNNMPLAIANMHRKKQIASTFIVRNMDQLHRLLNLAIR